MGLFESEQLVNSISPPIDQLLATQLIDEFISLEKRFIQRDWEPAELDGGQYCEALARILYHLDSGNLSYTRSVNDCYTYINNDQVNHSLDRISTKHLFKVITSVYKFRSQRGAVHISPTYSPNHMDSKYMIESVRWCMNETLRIFWQSDRDEVAKVIRELLQFDVPCVGEYEDALLVQRTDLSNEEEILILLHYAGDNGFTRKELLDNSMVSSQKLTIVLSKLTSSNYRQVIKLNDNIYRLTDLGSKRIREDLSEKLLLE